MSELVVIRLRVIFIGIFAVLGLGLTAAVALITKDAGITAALAGLTGMAVGGLLGSPRAAGTPATEPAATAGSTEGTAGVYGS